MSSAYWDKHQVSRLERGGQFNNFGYLPNHSPRVTAILAENSDSDSDLESQD